MCARISIARLCLTIETSEVPHEDKQENHRHAGDPRDRGGHPADPLCRKRQEHDLQPYQLQLLCAVRGHRYDHYDGALHQPGQRPLRLFPGRHGCAGLGALGKAELCAALGRRGQRGADALPEYRLRRAAGSCLRRSLCDAAHPAHHHFSGCDAHLRGHHVYRHRRKVCHERGAKRLHDRFCRQLVLAPDHDRRGAGPDRLSL